MDSKSSPSSYRYLIVGGGVAGVTAAETIRASDQTGTIAIVSDEPHPLYSRVMLSKPNFFLERIPFDQVWLKGKAWYEEKNIAFRGGQKAVRLDPANQNLILADGTVLHYEKLLLAPGVQARLAKMPGAEKPGVHYLRNLEDGQAIMTNLKAAHSALTVGGGFISFEMAELFNLAGLKTSLIIREKYFWEPILDEAGGLMIEEAMRAAGVQVIKENEIVEILGEERVTGAKLKDGQTLPVEMIAFGIGVENNLDWLKVSGLATNRGILANEYLETNHANIWTAGDIAEYRDLILGETVELGNWVNAHKQGEVAGHNMLGQREPFRFVSFYTTNGFGLSIAFVGDATPSPERTIITRGTPESKTYGRLLLAGEELVGASLINRPAEMGLLAQIIEKNANLAAHHAELADPNFDLKNLIV